MGTVIKYTTNSISITADWFEPAAIPYSIVVVAYGTEGLNAPFDKVISEYCLQLTNAGFAVIRPDYFNSTNTSPGMDGVFMSGPPLRFDTWVEAISDAAAYALSAKDASGNSKVSGKFAIVGFSLGANLSLRAAADSKHKANAVVDFFGPIDSIPQSPITSALAAKLPPVQIIHGDMDGIVHFSESGKLESRLKAAGVACDFDQTAHVGSGHPGQKIARKLLPGLPNVDWSAKDQSDSTAASIAFLKKYL